MPTTSKKARGTQKRPAAKQKKGTAAKQNGNVKQNTGLHRKIIAIILILFGAYGIYAFTNAVPGVLDSIVGKTILTYLFGNMTVIVMLYVIVLGIMLLVGKLRNNAQVMVLVFLLLVNMMIAFSIGKEGLMDRTVIELFDINVIRGTGGVIGVVLAYFLQLMIRKAGTIAFIIITSIGILLLILRAKFPEVSQKLQANYFGLIPLKHKIEEIIADHKTEAALKEKRAAKDEKDDFDSLFGRSDEGEVSVETEMIDTADINSVLGDDPVNLDDTLMFNSALAETLAEREEAQPAVDNNEKAVIGSGISTLSPEESGQEEIQKELGLDKADVTESKPYVMPTTHLLAPVPKNSKVKREDIRNKAKIIEQTLQNFGVHAKIIGVDIGPSITRFELQPEAGVKVNKIVNLSDDLALALATSDIRIEAPIPGKAAIGIEVPNAQSDIVGIRGIIESRAFQEAESPLTFALGKTLSGQNIIGDISKMPHMLIAGATGSGKSVCINSIIISILYKASPDDVKFIMIDPKMVELNQYNAIPHLLIPVVTDPKKAVYALNWGIKEMTDRYQLFKENGVREIDAYNHLMEMEGGHKLPRIVIIIDELADLMMTSPKEIESAICRIAQLARACGIHLVIATQRPSVDVITGLIKANIPSRIAFSVASNTDSRTILDMAGAEKLLGKGDMLYFPVGKSKPLRVQCTFVSDAEINRIIKSIKQNDEPIYDETIEQAIETQQEEALIDDSDDDPLIADALEVAFTNEQLSTSMLQRRLKVGYARAGRLVDTLEQRGVISGPNGSKPRKLLVTREEYERQKLR